MSNDVIHHLHQLDLDAGCSLEELRKSYHHLSFIWHPDHQPESYADLAKAKMQNIQNSYDWLILHADQLQFSAKNVHSKDPSNIIQIGKTDTCMCIRCMGSGLVAIGVNWKGAFEYETCSTCDGRGRFVVDLDSRCLSCSGEGINTQVSDQDRDLWIQEKMQQQGWLLRKWSPHEYKRQWLRFFRENMICAHCQGAGYSSHRQDIRRKDRRLPSAADFLRDLQKKRESRRLDRRASPCGA